MWSFWFFIISKIFDVKSICFWLLTIMDLGRIQTHNGYICIGCIYNFTMLMYDAIYKYLLSISYGAYENK